MCVLRLKEISDVRGLRMIQNTCPYSKMLEGIDLSQAPTQSATVCPV